MKKAYFIFYTLIGFIYLFPPIPMSIKGILGLVFIFISCIRISLKGGLITATLCIILGFFNMLMDINVDFELEIVTMLLGSALYYVTAYYLGRFAENLKYKNSELSDEIESRKMVEKELMEKLTLLQSLMDTIPSPVFFKDLDCRFLGCNHAFVTSIGISDNELLGKTSGEIIDINSASICNKTDMNLLDGLGRQTYENVVKFADGSLRNIIFSKDIITDENKNPVGIVGVMTDITDKIEAEKLKQNIEEKKQIIDEILENDKMKTEFFSNISHELRTPLNVILGSVQLMELYLTTDQYANSKEKIIKKAAIMKQNCYRLVRLVNNLIDISKIDAKALEIHLHNHDIVRIVKEITLSVSDYIENKGLHLKFATDVDEKIMPCDNEKIERVLLNLLSNATKFTPMGGEISVSINDKINGLCIKVEDNGIGIPENKQNQIFQRFCQIDRIFTRQHEGSGIGLSLVKSLVEMHKGTITFESCVGRGTSFLLYLPLQEIEEDEIQYNAIPKQAHIERIHVEFSDIYL